MSKKVSLGEISSLKTGPFGTQLSASEYVETGIPVINVRNIGYGEILTDDLEYVRESTASRLKEHLLREGDIVFGRKGSVDRHAFIDERYDGWMQGSDCIRVRIVDGINPHFVSHYLKLNSVKKQINDAAVGSTMASLNTDILGRIQITLPALDKQNAVEGLLSLLEKKIENNSIICAELESMAKTLYDYWFVQFDFPDENGKPYRSNGGEMIWNALIKRHIPINWVVKQLNSCCNTLLGGTPDTDNPDYWNGDIPWLNSGEIASSPVLASEKTITASGMDNSATSFANAGAVVMSITRYIRPSILGIDACFNQSVVAVLPSEELRTSFLYPFLQSMVPQYMSLRTGAQQPHINKDIVDNTVMVYPSDKRILDQYYSKVDRLFELQTNIAKQTKDLIALRDWLLPMLMNGQATIKRISVLR